VRREGILASPYVLGLLILVALPGIAALFLAFTEFTGIQAPRFNGLDNISRLLSDNAFWRSLGNSLIYVLLAVPLRLAIAIGFALLLYRRAPGIGAARAAVYLPSVVPDVAYGLLWLWLLNPIYGPLAIALGSASPDLLTDPWGARIGMALMGAFQVGEAFVIALTARRMIPHSLHEAAAVDGASAWFTLRRVTLPLMAPVMALLALRDIILSLQVSFVPAMIVTDGGPRYATTYLPLYVYRTAFSYFRFGYAAALSLSMFVLTAVILYVQYRLARRYRLI
jgi:multiple sugar transport system permease protein